MDCQIHRVDNVAEVTLVGSLDSAWSSYLSDRLDEVIRSGALNVNLDLTGVSYLSSNGIALLVGYHKQLRRIGGRLRIVADSEAVSYVLRLTGVFQLLHDESPTGLTQTTRAIPSEATEREGMTLQIFEKKTDGKPECVELVGDPARLPGHGYGPQDEQTWRAAPEAVALGLGALGPSFEACCGRFGEFLAAGGYAVYRPSAGPGRPDFEHAAGEFVPAVRMLYGLAFSVERASVIRFEAKGEPGSACVSLSHIAGACLHQARCEVVGVVLAGESDGLVGAALRQSPVNLAARVDPFAHPDARDWLSLTPEPEHSRSTALVVGVAAEHPTPALRPFIRPLVGETPTASEIQGHFHAAVVPYRPLAAGPVKLPETVSHLFAPGRIETILHLLGDSRPIVGAGESTFTRGAIWYVPLSVPENTKI
jgi:anti-anti-sigma factor